MKKNLILLILLSQLYLLNRVNGQDTIYFNNPSFEDFPRAGMSATPPIKGWQDCGVVKFPGESPPDIHPAPNQVWGVNQKPFDGNTYLGLVIRYNDTWESVSQGFKTQFRPDQCYSFHAFLCLSPKYESYTKRSISQLENFSNPVVLRIWGGNNFCDKRQLLSTSTPVDNHEWKDYTFEFKPTIAFDYITLEAYYYFPEKGMPYYQPGAYNGHVLVDGLSPIVEMECK